MPTSAFGQHGVSKFSTGCLNGDFVVEPRIFECSKSIGTQHFGPFVAEVTRRVASREDVLELAQETVFRKRWQRRRLLCDFGMHVEGRLITVGIKR